MTVERTTIDNKITYNISSKVSLRLLFKFTVDYQSSAEYKEDILQKELLEQKMNGSSQNVSSIEKKGEHYLHILNGVSSREAGPIKYTVSAIYYNEPYPNQKVFSSLFGQHLTFKQIGDHVYELQSPDGLNTYTYTNGICTEVKIVRDFATFYFKMSSETLLSVKNKDEAIVGN